MEKSKSEAQVLVPSAVAAADISPHPAQMIAAAASAAGAIDAGAASPRSAASAGSGKGKSPRSAAAAPAEGAGVATGNVAGGAAEGSSGESVSPRSSGQVAARGDSFGSQKSQKSGLSPRATASVVTAASDAASEVPKVAVLEETSSEKLKKTMDFQVKEVQMSAIVIEGEQLVHALYDAVVVNLRIGETEWTASSFMQREKGSKRRSYAIKWPEVLVTAEMFREEFAFVTVAVADSPAALSIASSEAVMNSARASPMPFLSSTTVGESPNSAKIPLYLFMRPSFDVVQEVRVPPIVTNTKVSSTPTASAGPNDVVKITITGNARDPKGLRTARIMSMRPQDLMNIKFDLLELEDNYETFASDEEEEEEEDVELQKTPMQSRKSPQRAASAGPHESPLDAELDEELNRTLYPHASEVNLSMYIAPSNK
jgi:hypothetical protein